MNFGSGRNDNVHNSRRDGGATITLTMIVGCARRRGILLTSALLLFSLILPAQDRSEGEIDKSLPAGITAEQIIQRFTAKEKEWKKVREQYTFRQTVQVNTLDRDESTGEYRQVADIRYVNGSPTKTVVLGPQPSLQLSKEDLADLETRATFTISTDELPEYHLTYVGQQKLDELHCYVFDVAPKRIQKERRYFEGRLWIDDQDFQIVKNRGKSVPDIKIQKRKRLEENLFPEFTTWRQQVDGKYWFPTFSKADDLLHFAQGDQRIREVLRFTDYKPAAAARP